MESWKPCPCVSGFNIPSVTQVIYQASLVILLGCSFESHALAYFKSHRCRWQNSSVEEFRRFRELGIFYSPKILTEYTLWSQWGAEPTLSCSYLENVLCIGVNGGTFFHRLRPLELRLMTRYVNSEKQCWPLNIRANVGINIRMSSKALVGT